MYNSFSPILFVLLHIYDHAAFFMQIYEECLILFWPPLSERLSTQMPGVFNTDIFAHRSTKETVFGHSAHMALDVMGP